MLTSRRLVLVLIALSLLPLLVYAVGGTGTRYFADDYCIAVAAASADPLALTLQWYGDSSGRLAQFVTMALLFKPGVWVAQIAPAVLLVLWAVGLGWLGVEAARALHLSAGLGAAGGVFALAAIIGGTPQVLQSVYWLTGILTYAAAGVVGSYTAALALHIVRTRRADLPRLGVFFLLALAAGLFNEPYTFAQGALFGGGLVAALVVQRRQRALWTTLAAGTAASALALVVLVAAPGNAARQTSFDGSGSLVTAGAQALVYALAFTPGAVAFNPLGAAAAFVVGVFAGGQMRALLPPAPRRRTLWLLLILYSLGWLTVVSAFMLPGLYATQSPPPGRAFILLMALYIPWLIGLGVLVRLALWQRAAGERVGMWEGRAAAVLVAVHAVWASVGALTPAQFTLQHGSEWDAQRVNIAAGPRTDAVVLALRYDLAAANGLETVGADPQHWVNLCAARYYDVASLRTQPPVGRAAEGG